MTAVIIIVVVVVVLLLVVALMYNSLVRARNRVDNAWSQIDVQLKRRYDLIPNLVETVKGYAAHETGTFEAVVRARGAAMAAGGAAPADRAAAENALTASLGRLLVLAEAYPTLRASENFSALQGELATTEDKIAYARQFYNSATQTFNTSTQTIPTNLIAGPLGFRATQFFETTDGERGPVQVRF